jgi:hypothetical protein
MSTRATIGPAPCRVDAEQLCARLGVWLSCTGTVHGRVFKVEGEIVCDQRRHENPDWAEVMETIKAVVKRKREQRATQALAAVGKHV